MSPLTRCLAALCLLLLAACGEEFSNAPFEDDALFLAAAPRARALRLEGPAPEAEATAEGLTTRQLALRLDDTAELYRFTRGTTLQLNSGVFALLRDVDRLVARPPSLRAEGRREWGPFRHPLEPLESRLVMERDGEGFTYALERRRAADPGDWVPVVVGRFDPEGDEGDGIGTLSLDIDASSRLTGTPGRGLVEVEYERLGPERSLTMQFQDFAPGGAAKGMDATYFYRAHPQGGEFEYAFNDEQDRLIEVRSRWRRDGAGRADALVHSTPEVVVSECWGVDFSSSWRAMTPAFEAPAGDPATCVFPDRELPSQLRQPTGAP